MAQSEAFFHRWGALAVFFARFVPPIRAFVPITAGALGMSPLQILSASIFRRSSPGRCAHVLPGVLAVSALHQYAGLPHHEHHRQAHVDALRRLLAPVIARAVIWTLRRRHEPRGDKSGEIVATTDQWPCATRAALC